MEFSIKNIQNSNFLSKGMPEEEHKNILNRWKKKGSKTQDLKLYMTVRINNPAISDEQGICQT